MRDATSLTSAELAKKSGLQQQASEPQGALLGESQGTSQREPEETPLVGKFVPGYAVPVINERAVRASAGILFLLGAIAWGGALANGSMNWLKPFGFFFVIDMAIRVGLGDRWSPTMALGRLAVMGQKPEWVGASQKLFAWWLGFLMAATFCASTGFFGAPLWVPLMLCGFCLSLLFLETAFGICVGCKLQAVFGKKQPMYCPGGTCDPVGEGD